MIALDRFVYKVFFPFSHGTQLAVFGFWRGYYIDFLPCWWEVVETKCSIYNSMCDSIKRKVP
jgi:hypothetical protein